MFVNSGRQIETRIPLNTPEKQINRPSAERHSLCNGGTAPDGRAQQLGLPSKANKAMKTFNRKIGLTVVLGVVLVAPFLLIASTMGVHAAGLAINARPEVFCFLLALASVAARISDGHLALARTTHEQRGCNERNANDRRGSTAIRVG